MADILERAAPFLTRCASCDAGLLATCTCTQADHRPVMLELVREVERLRAELATTRAAATPCSLETEVAEGKRISALGLGQAEAHFVIGALMRGTPEGLISAVLTEIEQRRGRMSDREHDALMDERMHG